MIENEIKIPRVMLCAVDTGAYDIDRSLDELEELARTAGAETVVRVIQKRPSFEPGTCIGSGRLEEMAGICERDDIDQIIFDHELTATQIRNIEEVCKVHTIDRTMLILDIFAQRATTREGRLQVEIAQHRYRLPRLAGMGVKLSRLGAGIGTRGPGESKLETDKRHIRTRIAALSGELKEIEKRRTHQRARRKKDGVLVCAIVGYTNVGKSTLLNTLTEAGVLAENKLFATLDPTTRLLSLGNDEPLLMTDTVGFIDKLPHHLIDAFRSTLEEAKHADLIVHVVDCSNPEHETQMQVVYQTLKELGVEGKPIFTLMNKQDLLSEEEKNLFERDMQADRTIEISVKDGTGLDELREVLLSFLRNRKKYVERLYGYDEMGKIQLLRKYGQIVTEEYRDDGVAVTGYVPNEYYNQIQ